MTDHRLQCLVVLGLNPLDQLVGSVIQSLSVLHHTAAGNHNAKPHGQRVGIPQLVQIVVVNINPAVLVAQLPGGDFAERVIFLYNIILGRILRRNLGHKLRGNGAVRADGQLADIL